MAKFKSDRVHWLTTWYRKQQNAQPKAWQGPNPITQRASSSMSNGADKASPKLPPQTQKSSGDANADKHAHDRLLYLLANFAVRSDPVQSQSWALDYLVRKRPESKSS